MNKKWPVVLLVMALIYGCAVPYQKKGFYGGYLDVQLDTNTVRVTYEGDGRDINDANIFNYLLYRCAEVTVEKGFDYFIGQDASGGSTMSGIVPIGGMLIPVNKAVASTTITLYKGTKPNVPNAYDARELMRNLAPHINLSGR